MAESTNFQVSNARRLWIGVLWGGVVGLAVGWVASLLGVAVDAAEDVANNQTSDLPSYVSLFTFIAMWGMLSAVALGSFLGGVLAWLHLHYLAPAGGALVAVGFFALVLAGSPGGIDPTVKNFVFAGVLLVIGLIAGITYRDRVDTAFVPPQGRSQGAVSKS